MTDEVRAGRSLLLSHRKRTCSKMIDSRDLCPKSHPRANEWNKIHRKFWFNDLFDTFALNLLDFSSSTIIDGKQELIRYLF